MKYWDVCLRLLGGGRRVGAKKDQVLTICPGCRKKKFYFSLTSGKSQCKSGSCSARFASVFALEKYITTAAYTPALTGLTSSKELDPWRGETGDARLAYDVHISKEYLLDRGVDYEAIGKEGIWAMPRSGTLIFPVYNFFSGELSPYYRYLSGSLRWVGEPGFERVHHVFMGTEQIENLHTTNGEGVILVTEGIFDLLSPWLQDYGLATLGASYSVFLMAFISRHFAEVWHLPDNDQAGEASVKRLRELCKTYNIEYKNLNRDGWLYEGSGASDPAELIRFGAGQARLEVIRKAVRAINENKGRKRKGEDYYYGGPTPPR